jgi:hypothetical protein
VPSAPPGEAKALRRRQATHDCKLLGPSAMANVRPWAERLPGLPRRPATDFVARRNTALGKIGINITNVVGGEPGLGGWRVAWGDVGWRLSRNSRRRVWRRARDP